MMEELRRACGVSTSGSSGSVGGPFTCCDRVCTPRILRTDNRHDDVIVGRTYLRSAGSEPDRQECEEHDDEAEPEAHAAKQDGEGDLPGADDATVLEDGPSDERHDHAADDRRRGQPRHVVPGAEQEGSAPSVALRK